MYRPTKAPPVQAAAKPKSGAAACSGCDTNHCHDHDHIDLEGFADDELDPCCMKEKLANEKRSRIMGALRSQDTVAQAEDRRRQVLSTTSAGGGAGGGDSNDDYPALLRARQAAAEAHAAVEAAAVAEDEEVHERRAESDGDASDSDDSEFDHLLDEVDATPEGLRLRQVHMEAAAERAREEQRRAAHGYGRHAEVPRDDVEHVVNCLPRVLVHFYSPDSDACAAIDMQLEGALAPHWQGTRFIRARAPPPLALAARMGASYGGSGGGRGSSSGSDGGAVLAAFKDGVCVAMASDFRQFGGFGRIEPEVLLQWLDHSGVLQQSPLPLAFLDDALGVPALGGGGGGNAGAVIAGRAGGGGGDSGGEEEEEERRYDCGRSGCNKSFAHSHVDGDAGPQTLIAPGLGGVSAQPV